MKRIITYHIDNTSTGLRIEQYLRRLGYSYQNLTQLKKMPESILINGVWAYMRTQLKDGDVLTVRIRETESSPNIPAVKLPLDIIYEDEDIIVVNKPAGMPVHPSLNNYRNSLANALMYYYQEQGKPHLSVHKPPRPGYFRPDRDRKTHGKLQHPLLYGRPP